MTKNPSKRECNVMLRLTLEEHSTLVAAKPRGEDLASFVRRQLLTSLASAHDVPPMREVAAFIVAALSDEHSFDDALILFDEHAHNYEGEMTHGFHD